MSAASIGARVPRGGRWRRWMLASLVIAILVQPGTAAVRPDPEVGDGGTGPFYSFAGAIPAAPGRLLRQQPASGGAALAGAARGVRMLYSSRGGADGRTPVAVSGTVYVPRGDPPAGGWPVIAWAHGTVGFADICAPSFAGWSARDTTYLNAWLAQGYAVVASDYEGLGTPGAHPYMVSRPEARGIWDAVRAARRPFGLSGQVVLVGQSQGAHAAAAAALMRGTMAPELDLRGVVLTGLPGRGDIPPLVLGGFTPYAVIYLQYLPTYAAADPRFAPSSVLTPAGRAVYDRYRTTCGSAATAAVLKDKPPSNMLFAVDPSPLEARMAPRRGYPPLAFTAPVFIGIGEKDEQTSPREAFAAAQRACALGSNVRVQVYPGIGHAATVLASQPDTLPFVRAAFAGHPLPSACATLKWPGD